MARGRRLGLLRHWADFVFGPVIDIAQFRHWARFVIGPGSLSIEVLQCLAKTQDSNNKFSYFFKEIYTNIKKLYKLKLEKLELVKTDIQQLQAENKQQVEQGLAALKDLAAQ